MYILSENNSIVLDYLAEIRDEKIQEDRMRFRQNLKRIGYYLAYEVSKRLSYKNDIVQTPLGQKPTSTIRDQPVIISILRAGLPLHQAFLEVFDKADNGFIGAYRGMHDAQDDFEIELDYVASCDLQGKDLILCDPMLATGRSLEKAYHALLRFGIPRKTHFVSVIASKKGAAYVQERMPECELWLADLDPELNDKSFIVPGLGDAGDLAFGPKN